MTVVWVLGWLGLGVSGAQAASDPRILGQPRAGTVKAGKDFGLDVLPGGTPPFSYQWYFKGSVPSGQTNRPLEGQTNLILWLVDVTAAQQGAYSVEVGNAKGTTRSKSVNLSVTDPLIVVQPLGGRVVAGTNVTMEVVAIGLEPFSYQWYLGDRALSGQTSRVLELANVTLAQSGSYSVRVKNLADSAKSSKAKLTVVDLAIDTQPKGAKVGAGEDVCFAVQAFGSPPLAYQWYFNGAPLQDETHSILCLTNVTPAQAGTYSAQVRNALTTKTSAGAKLSVKHPSILRQPQGGAVVAGTNFCFEVEAYGTAPLTYQWYRNGKTIPGAITSALCLTDVTPDQSGAYYVRVTDPAGGVQSSTANLTVYELAIVGQPQGGAVRACTNFCFAVQAAGVEPIFYQWLFQPSFPAGQPVRALAGQTNESLCLTNVTGAQGGAYFVQVSNPLLTNTSAKAALQVSDPVIVTQPGGGEVLAGTNVCLAVSACGLEQLRYQWYFNRAPLSGATNSNFCLDSVTTNQSGNYSVLVGNAVGTLMSSNVTLTVVDLKILDPPKHGSAPVGSNFCFSVEAIGTAPLTYQWFFNATNLLPGATGPVLCLPNLTVAQSGFYRVRVTNPAGSLETPDARLTVFDLAILRQPRGGSVVAGDNFVFSVEAMGIGPLTYQWLLKNRELPGETNRALLLTNVTTRQAGAYSVRVSNPEGSLVSASADLTVSELLILRQPEGATVLAGSDYCFAVVAGGTPPFSYQWFTNGVALPGATDRTLCLEYVTEAQSGSYSVLVSNLAGARLSDKARLTVLDPAIWLHPVGGWVLTNGNFRFEVVAAGTQPLVYQWYFKKKTLPGEVNPVLELKNVTTAQAGDYYVRVRNAVASVNSSNAHLAVYTGPSEPIRFLSTGAFLTNPPGRAELQILLQGNGEENALSFSMRYDPHILGLGDPAFIPAANATVTVTNIIRVSTNVFPSPTNVAVTVTNVVTNGVVGVAMRLDSGRTFLRTNVQVIGALRFDVVGTNSPLLGGLSFEDFLPPPLEPILPFTAADTEGNLLGLGAVLRPSGVLLQEIPALHEQSGLFRQQILLSNPTAASADGVEVAVYGLGPDSQDNPISLANAHSNGTIDANQDGLANEPASFVSVPALARGRSAVLTMEYSVSDHTTVPGPFYRFSFGNAPSPVVVPKSEAARIRAAGYVNGEFQLEFATKDDKTYYVQYADTPEGLSDPQQTKTSNPPIQGTGGVLFWFEVGLPRTEGTPEAGVRFYRLRASPPD